VHRFDAIRLSSSKKITVNGDVELYVDGEIKMSASAEINVTPGSKLTMYHDSGDVTLSGHGLVNSSYLPTNFLLKSSTTGTVKVSGSSGFYGAVYAPDADVKITGNTDTYGAFVGSTVDFQGTADFHYDEALGELGGGTGDYIVKAWRQVQ
jgi:hypothetical protein